MYDLTAPQTVRELMARHRLFFKKGFGQNFLIDSQVPDEIARLSGIDGEFGVLEIGPGIGTLTCALAKKAKKVVAVEIDRSLEGVLAETTGELSNVKVIFGDILKQDIAGLIEQEFAGMPVACVANLPYYITTAIVTGLLEAKTRFQSLTFMVQEEVASRFCAEPGGRDCGAITLFIHYYAEPEIVLDVPKQSFLPAPKVDSAVIRLKLRDRPPVTPRDEAALFRLIRASFNQRRKTFVNGVANSGLVNAGKDKILAILEELGIDPNIRGEKLTLEQFCAISDRL